MLRCGTVVSPDQTCLGLGWAGLCNQYEAKLIKADAEVWYSSVPGRTCLGLGWAVQSILAWVLPPHNCVHCITQHVSGVCS